MNEKLYVLGTPIHNLTMQETIDLVDDAIARKKHIHHTVVNAGKIVAMHQNPELRESVINADIINADGQAVVWASKFLGKRAIKERVAGIDLMQRVVELAHQKNYKIFFFGAEERVLQQVIDKYKRQFSPELIAGYRNGYYKKDEEEEIVHQIANSKANILFVAMSSPKKENFLYQNREVFRDINFIMGVGGSFDVVAGVVKRAPVWMQRSGLEWFYRVCQEPKRMFKRYLTGNLKFLGLLLWYILYEYRLLPFSKQFRGYLTNADPKVVSISKARRKNYKLNVQENDSSQLRVDNVSNLEKVV